MIDLRYSLEVLERLPVSILVFEISGRVVQANEKARTSFKIRGSDFELSAVDRKPIAPTDVHQVFEGKLEQLLDTVRIAGSAADVITAKGIAYCLWMTRVNDVFGDQLLAMAAIRLNEPDILIRKHVVL